MSKGDVDGCEYLGVAKSSGEDMIENVARTASNHGGDSYVVQGQSDNASLETRTHGMYGGGFYGGRSSSYVEHHRAIWAEVYRCGGGHSASAGSGSETNLESLNLTGPVRPRAAPTAVTPPASPAALARVRAAPKVPELGATAAEAKVLCEREHGTFVGGTAIGCKVGGVTIFACSMDDADQMTQCDGYFEGADLADMRAEIEGTLGAATLGGISSEGLRIFTWATKGQNLSLTTYAKGASGVRKTVAAAAP